MVRAKSQNERILAHLERGKPITSLDAFKRFGCTRLAARIRELKLAGHAIQDRRVEKNGKHVSAYWLA